MIKSTCCIWIPYIWSRTTCICSACWAITFSNSISTWIPIYCSITFLLCFSIWKQYFIWYHCWIATRRWVIKVWITYCLYICSICSISSCWYRSCTTCWCSPRSIIYFNLIRWCISNCTPCYFSTRIYRNCWSW